jgi:voltage-gated potassium channel
MTDVATRTTSSTRRWEKVTEWPMVVVAVIFLVAYAAPIIYPEMASGVVSLCEALVWASWSLFAVEYAARLALAENRRAFMRTHLLDLAIVTLPLLRPLRLLRLLVLLELAHLRAATFRTKVGTYVAGGAALLVLVGGLAITDAERGQPGAVINSVGDGWWWAFVTVTTVGYGDHYPVTTTGRLVAVGLMLAGIAVLGSVTGMFASWIVEQVREGGNAEPA